MRNLPEKIKVHDKSFRIIMDGAEVENIVSTVADRINTDYEGKIPLFLITLKGGIVFAVDLLKQISLECEIETITAKSYGAEMHSSGKVKLTGLNCDIKGKHVIIVEDIIDSGLTMKALTEELLTREPASIEIASFLLKPASLKTEVDVKYVGKSIPPDFVVGYGLDYNERGRQYPGVYVLCED